VNHPTRLIKTFPNGESLEYDTGVFDTWCTYLRHADGTRTPPRDAEYFSTLVEIGRSHDSQRLYSDIKKIYILTDKEISKKILDYISLVSEEYPEDRIKVEILFTILYAAFISEENKAHTKLGKRIKLLGIHQILIEGKSPEDAANFSKGMSWRDISKLCEERGF
jgi:hypothetical protein